VKGKSFSLSETSIFVSACMSNIQFFANPHLIFTATLTFFVKRSASVVAGWVFITPASNSLYRIFV
jgi:hypothetical protein